jgi:hypothetical protein
MGENDRDESARQALAMISPDLPIERFVSALHRFGPVLSMLPSGRRKR